MFSNFNARFAMGRVGILISYLAGDLNCGGTLVQSANASAGPCSVMYYTRSFATLSSVHTQEGRLTLYVMHRYCYTCYTVPTSHRYRVQHYRFWGVRRNGIERYRFWGCAGTVWKFIYRSHGHPRVLLKKTGGAPERYSAIGYPGAAGTVWNALGLGVWRATVCNAIGFFTL